MFPGDTIENAIPVASVNEIPFLFKNVVGLPVGITPVEFTGEYPDIIEIDLNDSKFSSLKEAPVGSNAPPDQILNNINAQYTGNFIIVQMWLGGSQEQIDSIGSTDKKTYYMVGYLEKVAESVTPEIVAEEFCPVHELLASAQTTEPKIQVVVDLRSIDPLKITTSELTLNRLPMTATFVYPNGVQKQATIDYFRQWSTVEVGGAIQQELEGLEAALAAQTAEQAEEETIIEQAEELLDAGGIGASTLGLPDLSNSSTTQEEREERSRAGRRDTARERV